MLVSYYDLNWQNEHKKFAVCILELIIVKFQSHGNVVNVFFWQMKTDKLHCRCRAVAGLASRWNQICGSDRSAENQFAVWKSHERLHMWGYTFSTVCIGWLMPLITGIFFDSFCSISLLAHCSSALYAQFVDMSSFTAVITYCVRQKFLETCYFILRCD